MGKTPKQYPIFVYGTLRPGGTFHSHIERYVEYSRPSLLYNVQLYDLGNFPAIRRSEVSDSSLPVAGDLLYIREESWAKCIAEIDWFENEGYLYRRELVRPWDVEGNSVVWAWAYIMQEFSGLYHVVEGNDWQKRG